MLVLGRKNGQSVRVGDEIRITVLSSSGGQVRIGIDAPAFVPVHREEVYEDIASRNLEAAGQDARRAGTLRRMDEGRVSRRAKGRVEERVNGPDAPGVNDAGSPREQEVIRFTHRRFGPLEIPAASVIHIDGMPGFPQVRRLALLEHDRRSEFEWLVSLDDPEVAFAVTEPHKFFPDYAPSPEAHDLQTLGAAPGSLLKVLTIATLGRGRPTLNLAAPLLVDPQSGRMVQAILSDRNLPVHAPLPLEPAQAGSAGPVAVAQIESKPQT